MLAIFVPILLLYVFIAGEIKTHLGNFDFIVFLILTVAFMSTHSTYIPYKDAWNGGVDDDRVNTNNLINW